MNDQSRHLILAILGILGRRRSHKVYLFLPGTISEFELMTHKMFNNLNRSLYRTLHCESVIISILNGNDICFQAPISTRGNIRYTRI